MAQDLWSKPDENSSVYSGDTRQSNPFESGSGNTRGGFGGAASFDTSYTGTRETLSSYIAKTYLWMFAGLLVTFLTALGLASSGLAIRMLSTGGTVVLIGVTIAEFVCVIAMSALINKISPAVAGLFFFIYAALTGVTFSLYFLLFDVTVLIYAFGATALFFGGMAAVSLIFKMELDSIRPILFGGLILLIVFGVLGAIFNLGVFNVLICYVGIAIFLGYTAYDTSKIRQNYNYYAGNAQLLAKASIFSALQLYLDFINLFLYILRLFSNRKN